MNGGEDEMSVISIVYVSVCIDGCMNGSTDRQTDF